MPVGETSKIREILADEGLKAHLTSVIKVNRRDKTIAIRSPTNLFEQYIVPYSQEEKQHLSGIRRGSPAMFVYDANMHKDDSLNKMPDEIYLGSGGLTFRLETSGEITKKEYTQVLACMRFIC